MAKKTKQTIIGLKGSRVKWSNVLQTNKAELLALQKKNGFLDLDIKECLPPLQRPKIVERPNYLFMILQFPVFDRTARKIRPVELDFFIGKNYLVTIHDHQLPVLEELFKQTASDKKYRAELLNESTAKLLYHVLDGLLNACFPMLVHVSNDVDTIEDRVHEVHDRNAIHEIFRLKTNIVNFKKTVQPHKAVIRKLIEVSPRLFPTHRLNAYLQNLVDHTKEIWDALEINSDTLNAIEDTHLSLINFRTGDIIRTLTIFSVIVFPLTLVAAVFGMNTKETPIVGHPLDFWIIIMLMLAGALTMLAYFKSKKWL